MTFFPCSNSRFCGEKYHWIITATIRKRKKKVFHRSLLVWPVSCQGDLFQVKSCTSLVLLVWSCSIQWYSVKAMHIRQIGPLFPSVFLSILVELPTNLCSSRQCATTGFRNNLRVGGSILLRKQS